MLESTKQCCKVQILNLYCHNMAIRKFCIAKKITNSKSYSHVREGPPRECEKNQQWSVEQIPGSRLWRLITSRNIIDCSSVPVQRHGPVFPKISRKSTQKFYSSPADIQNDCKVDNGYGVMHPWSPSRGAVQMSLLLYKL